MTDADDELLSIEPVFNSPLKTALAILGLSFCVSLNYTWTSTEGGVTVEHAFDYGGVFIGAAAVAMTAYAAILGMIAPDRKAQRVGLAAAIGGICAIRVLFAAW